LGKKREREREREREEEEALAFLMNCGVVLGFYWWGWEFLTARLLFSSPDQLNYHP